MLIYSFFKKEIIPVLPIHSQSVKVRIMHYSLYILTEPYLVMVSAMPAYTLIKETPSTPHMGNGPQTFTNHQPDNPVHPTLSCFVSVLCKLLIRWSELYHRHLCFQRPNRHISLFLLLLFIICSSSGHVPNAEEGIITPSHSRPHPDWGKRDHCCGMDIKLV